MWLWDADLVHYAFTSEMTLYTTKLLHLRLADLKDVELKIIE